IDRIRKRKLLARHTRHKPPAADLATRLQPAVGARQIPPRGSPRLAGQQPAEDDAVPAQQRPGSRLDDRVRRRSPVGLKKRPAARGVGPRRAPRTPPWRVQDLAHAGETVRRGETGRDKFSEALTHAALVARATGGKLPQERRAAAAQLVEYA